MGSNSFCELREDIMAQFFVLNIEENLSSEMKKYLYTVVSDYKKQRINKFLHEGDKNRCLYADILLRYLLCNMLNVKNEDVHFNIDKYGKPVLVDFSDVFFNISHSGKYVMCGISSKDIGVDIEKINDIDISIAKRFFTEEEYKYIENKPFFEQGQAFFDLWTLKECYIKYKGKGLSIPLDSFSFNFSNGTIIFKSLDEIKPYFYRNCIDDTYILAVCTEDDFVESNMSISLSTICNFNFY